MVKVFWGPVVSFLQKNWTEIQITFDVAKIVVPYALWQRSAAQCTRMWRR